MKFSEIEQGGWEELKPYLDTCVLPLTGLQGGEQPWEATMALEMLRDALDVVEIPFKGRTVTYPALHYTRDIADLSGLCGRLKREAGFRYVVCVTPRTEEELPIEEVCADLILRFTPEQLSDRPEEARREAAERMTRLWFANQTL
ncbi:DUF2487 family protein [Paenibacillus filicis]|uniref:DUF2487 family protein n=1 Tax=Paenibacillus gyeongsangnamensis TaxID=3388067 RepID=A0ABT4Q845_9BACL|nr:DUF2487 family protein [Paenibacillus filicis]MCZ8512962.1 DUF2487 family protein [Paenibacillus filicis]